MKFQLVDASIDSPSRFVDVGQKRGRLWPVYQTTEILMSRVEIGESPWRFSATDIAFFFYVETGSIEVALDNRKLVLETKRGLEIPEGSAFRLTNLSPAPSYLVMVAGRELLPGSFFNSFSNAYLNA